MVGWGNFIRTEMTTPIERMRAKGRGGGSIQIYKEQYSDLPGVGLRVQELIRSGMNPRAAERQAMGEYDARLPMVQRELPIDFNR